MVALALNVKPAPRAGAELPSRQDLPTAERPYDDEPSVGLKDSDRPFMQ